MTDDQQQVETRVGHDGKDICIVFNQKIEHLVLTLEGAESFIKLMQESMTALRKVVNDG